MTEAQKLAFLDELRATGSVMAGYRAAGVSHTRARTAARRDAEFEQGWVEALNDEAVRLAARVAARYVKSPRGIEHPLQAINPRKWGDTERWRASMTNPDPIAGALFRVRELRHRLRPAQARAGRAGVAGCWRWGYGAVLPGAFAAASVIRMTTCAR